MDKIKNNKKLLYIGLFGLAALVLGVSCFFIYNSNPTVQLRKQLDLGNKYLLEQDYESAVIAYENAITIDEMNLEAYAGGLEAYLNVREPQQVQEFFECALKVIRGLDDNVYNENVVFVINIFSKVKDVYAGDTYKVIEILKEGELITKDESIREALLEECYALGNYVLYKDDIDWTIDYVDSLITEQERVFDLLNDVNEQTNDEKLKEIIDKIKNQLIDLKNWIEWFTYITQKGEILVDIASCCEKEDYDTVFELMQSDEYANVIESIDVTDEIRALETGYGKIGIYEVNSDIFGRYMLYYGDYTDNTRQGTGVWLGYNEGSNYMGKGAWKNDLPNGTFMVREWSSLLYETVVYRVISGPVTDGLWNGDVIWSFEQNDGRKEQYPVTFKDGYWEVLYVDIDGDYVVSDKNLEGEERKLVIHNNDEVLGITGFATGY